MRADTSLASHREASAKTRDIGAPPQNVGRDERRDPSDASLLTFLETYFAEAFPLEWSADHRRAIEILQQVATNGGLFTVAMPRGYGKTTIAIRAAIWALLTGRRRHVAVICSTDGAAKKIIKAIRSELSFNDNLKWDYINELPGNWQLQGDNRRSGGQLCEGEKTGVVLGTSEIVFPTHRYSPIGGACVYSAGLTGAVRGRMHTLMSGTVTRPDFVILDDPQTRESAKSAAQTAERIEIVNGDVLGLAGPGKSIAAVMPCTVIEKSDLSEHFLKQPGWSSIRSKLLPEFPANLTLWDQYFELREEQLRTDGIMDRSDDFLRQHWEDMHAGAVAAWEARKQPNELSAVQSAMNLWRRSPSAFAAEYQNEPLVDAGEFEKPSAIRLAEKLINLPRGVLPRWATKLTAAIDVQQTCLYWMVCGWSEDYTGHIVDYGVFPEQPRNYFLLREVSPTLQMLSGSSQPEGAIRWGLDELSRRLLGRAWQTETGGEVRVSKCAVDAGKWPDTIHEFAARSLFGAIVLPCLGQGITAAKIPMERWAKRDGETLGFHWAVRRDRRPTPHGLLDTYFWKTFFCDRIAATLGEKGSMTIFGERQEQHRLLFDHLKAESPIKTEGQGRKLWEWKANPGQDNHWLDTLASNCAMASMLGVKLANTQAAVAPQRRVVQVPEHLMRR